jgi:hypothetical protein
MSFLNNLPFNWFDFVVLAVLGIGMARGRKHGMSEELIELLRWLAIAFGCAFTYEPLGKMLAGGSLFTLLSGYLIAYIGGALVITSLVTMLKKAIGEKLVGSDAFGASEFYLGMAAGMVRFCCILIAVLALLHARSYNSAEIRADIKMQNDVYGSNFFPKLYTIQAQVFERSFAGPLISKQLDFLLIKPTAPVQKQMKKRDYALP